MAAKEFDIVLLTQREYVNPVHCDPYIENVLKEDRLLILALEQNGLKVTRTHWDNKEFNWNQTCFALFRATWDYFHRFKEFHFWLEQCSQHIHFINPYSIIKANMDKNYLACLQQKGVNIPPTLFIPRHTLVSLKKLLQKKTWRKVILKPAIGGGARHTYLFDMDEVAHYEALFQQLLQKESLLVQEFQEQIQLKGELSFMIFGGQYSHCVLKKAKAGDFRVQDDFGGTVQSCVASPENIKLAEHIVKSWGKLPVYARVDMMWDNYDQLCLSELEMIEPELWLRKDAHAAQAMADAVCRYIKSAQFLDVAQD